MFFTELLAKFPTELSIIQYFISIRYHTDRPTCNHCGSYRVSHCHDKPKKFQCNACNNTFSVFVGTVFEHISTDLRKWFFAIHLMINSKKGISGYQLQREIDVTYKTAWRILNRIRQVMITDYTGQQLFHAFVEVDETYIGGKPRKSNDGGMKTENKRGRGTNKQPVVGLYDRDNHVAYAKVAQKNEKGKQLSGKQLLDTIKDVCKSKGTTYYTDQFKGYNILDKQESDIHLVVDHSMMFVDGDIHTNNIESFWGTLKRGILGIYHHVSPEKLQSYVDECVFRFNHRKGKIFFKPQMFEKFIAQTILA